MMPFALNLALTGLWVLITANPSPVNALVGFLLGLALLWWLWPHDRGRSYFRKLPVAISFTAFFVLELLRSSLRVAHDVVTPRAMHQPAIVCVPLDVRSDAEITLLANLVTLTPGTLALGLSGDRRCLYVHAMFAPDIERLRREIKEGYERRIQELLS